ncbi:MAG: sugar ABC transporter permease [Chloroflexota bacterium]
MKNLSSTLIHQIRQNMMTYAIIVALVVIWAFFGILTKGAYLRPQNFSNLFRQMTVTSLLAIGMVLIIVTGNIDLSVGKVAGFVSVVVASFQDDVWSKVLPNQPVLAAVLSVLIGLAVGILFHSLQGYLVAYLNIPSFIVTLGSMFIMRGGILYVTKGQTIAANQPAFSVIAQGYLPPWVGWVMAALVVAYLFYSMFRGRQRKRQYGFELPNIYLDVAKTVFFSLVTLIYVFLVNQYNGVQLPVLLLGIFAVIIAYVSNNTRFGRYAYAIGGNREAARLSGINIRRNIFMIFVLMGFLCGVAGIVLASYVGYGTIAAGEGYELDAIASAILGGTSTLGGVGTIFGALIGSLIMSSLTNGLQILNVEPAYQYLVRGIVLVLAVYADVYLKKSRQ